ncbi:MAG: enoyl-CoA hydratase/isomerase family protein, partial [Pseudomonas sp.]|nr:enoyl-CoA hydratase/isomerase family protein [Pseudomonas sp.]
MPSNLIVQAPADGVRLITLHRPQALNALNTALLEELAAELDAADQDPEIRAVVITGSRKAFAAGADINEMAQRDLVGILNDPRVAHWPRHFYAGTLAVNLVGCLLIGLLYGLFL